MTACMCLSNLACETDRSVKSYVIQSGILDEEVKKAFFAQKEKDDLFLKIELMSIFCNALNGASIDFIVYFLNKCQIV